MCMCRYLAFMRASSPNRDEMGVVQLELAQGVTQRITVPDSGSWGYWTHAVSKPMMVPGKRQPPPPPLCEIHDFAYCCAYCAYELAGCYTSFLCVCVHACARGFCAHEYERHFVLVSCMNTCFCAFYAITSVLC